MNTMISEGFLNLHTAVKLVGKLLDGTVFTKKGHDGESEDNLFEFKTDEGIVSKYIVQLHRSYVVIFPGLFSIDGALIYPEQNK